MEVPHPIIDMAPLPAMPLVLITTADHKLQLWSFISTSKFHECTPQLLVICNSCGLSSAQLSSLVLTTIAGHRLQLYSLVSTS